MEPRQAIQILDQVARNFQGNREDHQNLSVAVAVLQLMVNEKEAADKDAAMKSVAQKEVSSAPKAKTTQQKTEENAS